MREFRKKQKKLFKIMKALIIFTAVFILVYIGIKPTAENLNAQLALALNYITQILIILNLPIVFLYYSRYGKCDSFLERTECEISDYAYYFTSYDKMNENEFISTIRNELTANAFAVSQNTEISDLDFDICAVKKKEYFYVCNVSSVSRDDVLAYLDAVITDITVHKLKRAGNAVLCFVTDHAQEDGVALSKMITPLGKKEQLKIAVVIAEPETKKCYFLGNMETKCQQMILKYVLKSSSPIPDALKGERHMKFQDDIEEKMKSFNIKDFRDGTFYSH